MTIDEICHVKGHQDKTGKFLSTVENLNVIADKLGTRAVNEERSDEPIWHEMLGPMLQIDGKIITGKEGMMHITADSEELHKWQRVKLKMSQSDYRKTNWEVQHVALAKLPQKIAPIFHAIHISLVPQGLEDQVKQSTQRGQVSFMWQS